LSWFEWFYSVPHLNVDWGAPELKAVLAAPFMPGSLGTQKTLRLEQEVRRLTGAREALAFETGRAALRWILEAARTRPDARGRCGVILPSLICRAVLEAVRAAGLTPVLCDVTENLTMNAACVKPVLDPDNTLAVVVPHIYGWPSPVQEVRSLTAPHTIPVIDDAAAALGGRHTGIPLGLQGDAGLFSFNQGKAAVAGWGGVLVLPEGGLFREVSTNPSPLLPASPAKAAAMFRHFLWLDFFHRFTGPVGKIMSSLRARLKLPVRRSILSLAIEFRTMAPLQAGVALAQLTRLKRITEGRRKNAESLREELARIPGLRVLPLPKEATPTRFAVETLEHRVVRDEGGLKEENPLAVHLRKKGIETRYVYFPLHAYQDVFCPDPSSLQGSKRLAERLLLLPFLPPLDRGGMARIGRAVREFFGR
jgi:dTDP-4-amino-4,6-dideoxygalactose transaminase